MKVNNFGTNNGDKESSRNRIVGHRLAESIHLNRFLGSKKGYKIILYPNIDKKWTARPRLFSVVLFVSYPHNFSSPSAAVS
jgi:hypothetical protein